MTLLRSPKFVERPDPTFRKYFDWPTHKDPKGTVKNQTVLLEAPQSSLPFKSSRGFVKPMKKREALKFPFKQKVADEDFRLLEAFISESFVTKKDKVKFSFILMISYKLMLCRCLYLLFQNWSN